jgi:hypothetical protein
MPAVCIPFRVIQQHVHTKQSSSTSANQNFSIKSLLFPGSYQQSILSFCIAALHNFWLSGLGEEFIHGHFPLSPPV